MNINLKINGIPFKINELIDKEKIFSAKIKKAGFFARRMIKVNKPITLYWAKNCEISFFNDELTITPNLDSKMGASMMFGTSCYLFCDNERINRMTVQIIKNSGASQYYAKKLKDIAITKIGEPIIQRRNEISDLEKIVRWTDNEMQFLYEFNNTFENVYFHWLIDTQI